MWLEHKEAFPDAHAYSQFCELCRRWRRGIDVVMRQEHKAGEKLFVDFPGRKIPIYDEVTGELAFEAELFVAVLGASSYLYAEALRTQELLHWVTGHVHAFEALGGASAATRTPTQQSRGVRKLRTGCTETPECSGEGSILRSVARSMK